MAVGQERLVVRVGIELLALIDMAAEMGEMKRSEWVRGALEQQAVREVRPVRTLGTQRMTSDRCIHPVTARKHLPTKVLCGLCETVVKVL